MATTARRRDADDDIAAIAKQISDQAEAIYQNWKSRGLAPAELITCHAAGDTSKLGSMLKPSPTTTTTPSMEILAQAPTMDNNRLEKLVKNFVDEDKARIAASKRSSSSKIMPSSIQYALQKFENKNSNDSNGRSSVFGAPAQESNSSIKQPSTRPMIGQKPQIGPKPRLSSVCGDTIEMTLPADHHRESGSLQTWPLKNRVISQDNVKKSTGIDVINSHKHQNVNNIDHQIAVEEKKLINALKNGDVVNEEQLKDHDPDPVPSSTSVAALTTKWGQRTLTTSRNAKPGEQSIAVVPHPELTSTQRQHLRQNQHSSSSNPVRPFLTRGSVAERVLIFERCPSDLLLDKRVVRGGTSAHHHAVKAQAISKQQQHQQHTTLQRHVRAHRNVNIPRFHFPVGKPAPPGQMDVIKAKVAAAFSKIGERASREHFGVLTQACQLPLYWKTPLYLAACNDKSSCSMEQFMNFWQSLTSQCHDAASRFVYILTRGRRNWLAPEDFIPLVQDVVETHPGLTFLKEATEFHSRYVHTVIARIYYSVNRSWSGKVTIPEIRRSNLLNIIQLLEDEEDINQITQYFSYEHFYVIYCKFWELDRDHDLFIDKQDLTRHNDHALSSRIIDRILSGCVTRGRKKQSAQPQQDEKMSYTDFVWFLLSEEDKTHPTAIEYWFRCMDLDGDGYLSMYELEYFYDEQMHRMEAIGIETLPFQDCLCQMLDMVKPKIEGKISLSDLKKCKMTPIFFDTFFNLEKYLDHEQRDPFASQRDHDADGQEMSDWDRYAAEEYELLVAEEGGNDQQDSFSYDENNEDDVLSQNFDEVLDEDEIISDESDEADIF